MESLNKQTEGIPNPFATSGYEKTAPVKPDYLPFAEDTSKVKSEVSALSQKLAAMEQNQQKLETELSQLKAQKAKENKPPWFGRETVRNIAKLAGGGVGFLFGCALGTVYSATIIAPFIGACTRSSGEGRAFGACFLEQLSMTVGGAKYGATWGASQAAEAVDDIYKC